MDADAELLAKRVKQLTAKNNHIEARILVAKFLSKKSIYKKFLKKYEAISMIMDTEGHLPNSLSQYMYSVDKDLFSVLNSKEEWNPIKEAL